MITNEMVNDQALFPFVDLEKISPLKQAYKFYKGDLVLGAKTCSDKWGMYLAPDLDSLGIVLSATETNKKVLWFRMPQYQLKLRKK